MSAQIIRLADYRKAKEAPAFNVPRRPRGDAWKMSRRCAICRTPGHDRSTCELADEARALSKTLGVTFGDALARITTVGK